MPTLNRGNPVYLKDLHLSSSIDNSAIAANANGRGVSSSNSQVVHHNRTPLGAIERKEFDLRTALREFEKKQKKANKGSKSVEFMRPPFRSSTSDLTTSYIEAPIAQARPVEGSRVLFSDSTVNSPSPTVPTTPMAPPKTEIDDRSTNSLHSIISHNSLFRATDKDSVQKYMAELAPSNASLPPPESVEMSALTNTFNGEEDELDYDDDDIDFDALRAPADVPVFSFDIKYNNLSQWKAMSVQPKITTLKYKIIEDIMVREGLLIRLKTLIDLLDQKYWEYAALRVRKCTEQLVRQNGNIPTYSLGKPEEAPPSNTVYDPVKSRLLVRKQNRILILQNELGIAIALYREVTLAIIEKTMKMRSYYKKEFKTRSEVSIYWNNENYFAKIYNDMHIFHSTLTVRMYVGFQEFSPLFIPPADFHEMTLETRHNFMQEVYAIWLKKHREKMNRDRLLKHRLAFDNRAKAKRANASLMTTDRRYLMENLGVVPAAPTLTAATSAGVTTTSSVTIVTPTETNEAAAAAVTEGGEVLPSVTEGANEVAEETTINVFAGAEVPVEGPAAAETALSVLNPEGLSEDIHLLEQERELMLLDEAAAAAVAAVATGAEGDDLACLSADDLAETNNNSFEQMLEAISRKPSRAAIAFDDELLEGEEGVANSSNPSPGMRKLSRGSPARSFRLPGAAGAAAPVGTPESARSSFRLNRSKTEAAGGVMGISGNSPGGGGILRNNSMSIAGTAEAERSKPHTPGSPQRSRSFKSPASFSRPNSRSFQIGSKPSVSMMEPFFASVGAVAANESEEQQSVLDKIAAALDSVAALNDENEVKSEPGLEAEVTEMGEPVVVENMEPAAERVGVPIAVDATEEAPVVPSETVVPVDTGVVSEGEQPVGLTIVAAPGTSLSNLLQAIPAPSQQPDDASVPSMKSEEHLIQSPTAAQKQLTRDTRSPPKPLMDWQQLRDYAGYSWEQNPETLVYEQCTAEHLHVSDGDSLGEGYTSSANSLVSQSAFWNNLDQNPFVVEAVVGFKEVFPVKLIVPPLPYQLQSDCEAAESILEHELDLMDELHVLSEEASMLKSKLDLVANSEVVQLISEQSLMAYYNNEPCEEAERLVLRQQGNSELLTGISVEHFGSSMFEEMNVAYDIPTPHKSLLLGSEYSQLLPAGGSNSMMMHDESQVFLTDSLNQQQQHQHHFLDDEAVAAAQLAHNTLNNSLSEFRSEFKPHASMQSSFQTHGSYVDTRDIEAFRVEKSHRTRERIESRIDDARSFVEFDARSGINQLRKEKLGKREMFRGDDQWIQHNVIRIQCFVRIRLAKWKVERLRTVRNNFRRIIYVQKFLRGFLARKAAERKKYEFKKKMFIIRKFAIGKLRAAMIITKAIREFINWKRQQAGLTTFLRGYSRAAKKVKKERKRIRTILKPGVERLSISRERENASVSRGSVFSDSEGGGGSRSRSTSPMLKQKSSLLADDNEFSHSFALSFDGSMETRMENNLANVMNKAIMEAEKIVNHAMAAKEKEKDKDRDRELQSVANMSTSDSISTAAKLNRTAITKEKQKNEMSMVTAELEKMQLNAKMQALALVHRVNKDKVILDTVHNSRLIPMKTVEHVNKKVRKFSTKEYAFLTTNNSSSSGNLLGSQNVTVPPNTAATSSTVMSVTGDFSSTRPLSLVAMERANAEALERIYQGPIPASKKREKKTLRVSTSTSKILGGSLSQSGPVVLPALSHSATTPALMHSPQQQQHAGGGRRDSVHSADTSNSANKSINSGGGVSLFTTGTGTEQKTKTVHRSHTDIMEARAKAQSEMETIHMKNVLRNYF